MTAVENEEAILGCMLSHPDKSVPYVCAEMRPDHFTPPNTEIFQEILGLFSEGHSVDVMAVAGRLREKGKIQDVGGFPRLSSFSLSGAIPSLLPEHVRAVKEKAAHRRILKTLTEAKKEAESVICDVPELLAGLMAEIEEIGHDRARKKAPSMRELAVEAVARIQKRHDHEESETGVSTSIRSLDRETGGLRPGSQWVIAGPAKGGKSSLAITLLIALAVTAKKRCAFFGLEMPSVENVERMICQVGRLQATAIRDGELKEGGFTQLTAAAGSVGNAPIHFREDIFDLPELVGTVRQMKSAYPDLFAVFVDYAQLLGAGTDGDNREREVAIISRSLRKLSMQLGLCVILLSQVNDDGKLRESRSLGMDATTVVFIEFTKNANTRKLRLVQRNGRSGIDVEVAYVGEHFKFAELAREEGRNYNP